ncbi:Protein of uncharacterised function (DUF2848) [Bordetella ansorpii]|uniref:Protein of uncharacterized function (DUF2848) n=1 Tax=Bordetella ansorpii TaxID=288768 RepID=A0A157R7V4_9BORD|nr:DUF2848 domain-containing protein [Bordetella ansorpii]SAI54201.1 Protein of uncharacterised function (DUF2848) [Bordetella ansorpii]
MKTVFQIESNGTTRTAEVDIRNLVVAGWAGRDRAAIEHHIEELAAIGVPRPSSVPLYYRVAFNQVTQDERVQAVGGESSGEVEPFVFMLDGELHVSIASDHTDRKLEAHSVALSKQLCVKPVARQAWRHADVAGHWDELVLRSRIVENGAEVLYQEGPLSSLRTPLELIEGYTQGGKSLPDGTGMTCGTVGAIGGIRPSATFIMELHDPRLGRTISHRYDVEVLPEIA